MLRYVNVLLLLLALVGCSQKSQQQVVVYVSEDQVFSEPILKDFEQKTGIHVRALYDTEESKSTGVMNRILAEKANPQADVYWANEPIRAEILKQKSLLAPYVSQNAQSIPQTFKDKDGYWCGFSARARVFIVKDKLKNSPQAIADYINSSYKSQAVIANPLFGTTTSQIAALFLQWGDVKTEAFMQALKTNDVKIATSNGESADFVASGRYAFSLVDSDDVVSRMRAGKPVHLVYPDQKKGGLGCFIVPNTVMLLKGAQHAKNAKKLIDYLLSDAVERKLAQEDCAQIPLHPHLQAPKELKSIANIRVMQVDYATVAREMQKIQPFLKNFSGL